MNVGSWAHYVLAIAPEFTCIDKGFAFLVIFGGVEDVGIFGKPGVREIELISSASGKDGKCV